MNAVRELLLRGEVRLLTLVGPPGTGKTRLRLQVAATLTDEFADGILFIELAALQDATLVATTLAKMLGVTEVASQHLTETLKRELRDKQMLVVLDNFEHVMAAGSIITELLAAAPRLEFLITSRAVLNVAGEYQFIVPPLALPEPNNLSDVNLVAKSPAVTLFIQRAQAVEPDFQLTEENASIVAELCILLDGLPLAIELAAARTKLFTPQEMLTRLESRFQWLTSGARDLPIQQQTLQSALDWSYNLLETGEQTLFWRLGVFMGGCTLTAMEAVYESTEGKAVDVLEGTASLLDNSLLQRHGGVETEPYFWMLETVREYAKSKLFDSGEMQALRNQHLNFYLNLAETTEKKSWGREPQSLDQMEREHDNLRAALEWAHEQNDHVTLARLATAVYPFWSMRGYEKEGEQWVAAALSTRKHLSDPRLAELLTIYGSLIYRQGNYTQAQQILEEGLELRRKIGELNGIAWTVSVLGVVVACQGDYVRSIELCEEGLSLYRETASKFSIGWGLYQLGNVVRMQGDLERAETILDQGLVLSQEAEDRDNVNWSLTRLGQIMYFKGKYQQATALLKESLKGHKELGESQGIALCLAILGGIAMELLQHERAVRLFGAADIQIITADWRLKPQDRASIDRNVSMVRGELGNENFRAAWNAGQGMTKEQAITYALSDSDAINRYRQ